MKVAYTSTTSVVEANWARTSAEHPTAVASIASPRRQRWLLPDPAVPALAEVLQLAGPWLRGGLVEALQVPARSVSMFGRLGLPELVIILVIIILIFGANRLPDIGRGIGKGIKNFKDATNKSANDDNV